MDEQLSKALNDIFAWSQHIRVEAQKKGNDGIDDDALIIQEIIEDYLHGLNIDPTEVIDLNSR
ncbi:hypothetical protein CIL05_07710 [Virgibacillus profundi]|uniref:Uncharacterized protein n=1 Tax=Virgibacillus profundi TaxID=2024555 RepID=A0A2A2IG55_9BACI|nr:hypothetical protein [Virgibacillus profundi]PAV30348.1 hypothetical protein CIL05_07710 [Virgibacillus profundi]PXY54520.1 hypothetical protein CIT14_07795 [Virgibacillus profundi]